MANPAAITYEFCYSDSIKPSIGIFGDAGIDIPCYENVTLEPFTVTIIKTGLKIICPPNCYIKFKERSSVGLLGLMVFDNGFVYNSDKELVFSIVNVTKEPINVKKGDRLVQLILEKYRPIHTITHVIKIVKVTERGLKGLGSTGK